MSWQLLQGEPHSALPCILDHPGMHLSTSGRASILLAIEMLGIGPGDKVLVPTYHCPTMIAPVTAVGAEPVFYPVNVHGAAALDWLRGISLGGIKAIQAAHYFGLPQEMQQLRDWCDQQGIALIEDCAHSLFGRSGDRPVGRWGDIAIGSLTKFLPVPEGGCLVVNRSLPPPPPLTHPSLKAQVKAGVDIVHVAADHQRLTGFNGLIKGAYAISRFFKRSHAPVQAAASSMSQDAPMDGFTLDSQLSHRALTAVCAWVARFANRDRIVERRRHNYQELGRRLAGLPGMRPLFPQLAEGAAPYVFPLWVNEPDPGYSELRRLGIPVSRWDRLWPGIPELPGDVGTEWSHHVLQLACHQDLTASDLDAVVQALTRLYVSQAKASHTITAGAARAPGTPVASQA